MAKQTFNKIKHWLGTEVRLSRMQWLILGALLVLPVLAVGNYAAGLNYHSASNNSQIATDSELIGQLSEKNKLLVAQVEDQEQTIDKQKKDLSKLKNQNSDLNDSLAATQSQLADEQEEDKKCYKKWNGEVVCKDKKKKKHD